MDLKLKDKLFLVGGATGGFGRSVALGLVTEGAKVIAVARTKANLEALQAKYPTSIETIVGDITSMEIVNAILNRIGDRNITGALINAGGPPAMSTLNTTLKDWDDAYHSVFRWKVALTQGLVEKMTPYQYGRIVYVESVTIKQPVENLVLSNAMRLAVTGFVKTLSQEIGHTGITLNILGPGYHATQRMTNLFEKNSQLKGIPVKEIEKLFVDQTKVGFIGDPDDFASLALWLFSPYSKYITGQTITVDGGLVLGTLG